MCRFFRFPGHWTDAEKVGAVVDALFSTSKDIVIPAYYDMALKSKFARDDESGEMLDIIREGLCINFGYFYDIGGNVMFRVLLSQRNSNFASYYAANKKGFERNLRNILKTFESDEEDNAQLLLQYNFKRISEKSDIL